MIRTGIKFGAFVAVCLAFTLWLAFTIGNIHFPPEHTYKLSASFDDVSGLLPNDNVKVAGVVVGKVRSIKVDDGRAKVTFQVDRKYRLPSDSEAVIRWRNLIGQRYLYLYPGKASTVLESGDVIRHTRSVVDLGELFNRLGPIVSSLDSSKVNDFLDTVSQAIAGNEDKLSKAIDDLATLANGLATRDQTIGDLIDNLNTVAGTITTRDTQIRTMLDNLVAISQTFSDNTGVLDQALTELGDFSKNLNTILSGNSAEIDRMIGNLDLILQTVDTKLPVLDHALAGISQASSKIFLASRLGEWLDEDIECTATAPPQNGSCDSGGGVGGNAAGPATPAVIGSAAPSNQAGVEAITALMLGGER
jgi:phospholipid/cholesterol/gamma-HCH transport system substrate-binding protein